jgi:RIO kinase 1
MNDPLDILLDDGVIDEVLGRLKSGKEANIYLVERGGQVVAAKVYKHQDQRSFKNNSAYKEGRKVRNSRTQRAIEGGGRFGRAAAEQAWKSMESQTLNLLYARGVRVPCPIMFYEGVLLMELVTDAGGAPAPRLIEVALEREAARAIYLDLRAQIIGMLCCETIHGDLSPYNVLAAAGGPTIIDFPQSISAAHNTRAEHFFQRDFQNVVHHLAAADPSLAIHAADADAIWRAYRQRDLAPDYVPPPPRPPRSNRDRGGGGSARPEVRVANARRSDERPVRAWSAQRSTSPPSPPRSAARDAPRAAAPNPSAPSPGASRGHRRRPKRRW